MLKLRKIEKKEESLPKFICIFTQNQEINILGNLINGDQPPDDLEVEEVKVEAVKEVVVVKKDDVTIVKEKKGFLGIKPLQLLTEPGIQHKQVSSIRRSASSSFYLYCKETHW